MYFFKILMFLRRKESESIQLPSLCVFYYQNFYLFILHPVIPISRNATPLKEGNLLKNFLLPYRGFDRLSYRGGKIFNDCFLKVDIVV